MRVLGLDVGYGTLGYGSIETTAGGGVRHLASGVITTPKDDAYHHRLRELYGDIEMLFQEHAYSPPDVVVIEQTYWGAAVNVMGKVMQARGVVLLKLSQIYLGLEVRGALVELSASTVKARVAGNGKASKVQVKNAVRGHLNLPTLSGDDDLFDALALALTHCMFPKLGDQCLLGY